MSLKLQGKERGLCSSSPKQRHVILSQPNWDRLRTQGQHQHRPAHKSHAAGTECILRTLEPHCKPRPTINKGTRTWSRAQGSRVAGPVFPLGSWRSSLHQLLGPHPTLSKTQSGRAQPLCLSLTGSRTQQQSVLLLVK